MFVQVDTDTEQVLLRDALANFSLDSLPLPVEVSDQCFPSNFQASNPQPLDQVTHQPLQTPLESVNNQINIEKH